MHRTHTLLGVFVLTLVSVRPQSAGDPDPHAKRPLEALDSVWVEELTFPTDNFGTRFFTTHRFEGSGCRSSQSPKSSP